MIVTFFIVYNYLVGTWEFCKTTLRCLVAKQNSSLTLKATPFEIPHVPANAYFDEFSGIKFNPPVYLQRYMTVAETLKKAKSFLDITKIVDYGCSEMSFFPYLKHMEGIEEVLFVDIDEVLLHRFSDRVTPLTADYLKQRLCPLKVSVLQGSIADPDFRLKGTDAVVAIELIEHLYPDVVEPFPNTVLGIVQPKIAIFTTPNSEFNVLFKNFTGFRHSDHKFEWTREQFEDWANNLVDRFPAYSVSFKGIGSGVEGYEHLGCCSQMAVFIRSQDLPSDYDESHFKEFYTVINEKVYPYKSVAIQRSESIFYEAHSFIQYASTCDEFSRNDRIEIPLSRICEAIFKFKCTEEEIREILDEKWTVEKLDDGKWAVILPYYGLSDSCTDMSEEEAYEVEDGAGCSPRNCFDERWSVDQGNDASSAWSLNSWDPQPPPIAQQVSPTKESSSHLAHLGESTPLIQEPLGASAVPSERNQVTRCLSWDHISPGRQKNKNCRYSLNFDKEPVCDINGAKNSYVVQKFTSEEVLDSQSKALDSGYPNSFEQDMDLDLTPEQVDEIITETESSLDGDDESGSLDENRPHAQAPLLPPPPVHFQENVENGDVANNNRDGEGNNMEAGQNDVLQFEAVIDQQENAVGLEGMREPESDEENHFVSMSEATAEDTIVNSECSNESAHVHNGLGAESDFNSTFGSSTFASCGGSGNSSTLDYHRDLQGLSELSFISRNSSITVNVSEGHTEMSDVSFDEDYETAEGSFPGWLMNLLVEDFEPGGGDMGVPSAELLAPAGLENVESDSDILISADSSSVEQIVEGDVNGGGDFPT